MRPAWTQVNIYSGRDRGGRDSAQHRTCSRRSRDTNIATVRDAHERIFVKPVSWCDKAPCRARSIAAIRPGHDQFLRSFLTWLNEARSKTLRNNMLMEMGSRQW